MISTATLPKAAARATRNKTARMRTGWCSATARKKFDWIPAFETLQKPNIRRSCESRNLVKHSNPPGFSASNTAYRGFLQSLFRDSAKTQHSSFLRKQEPSKTLKPASNTAYRGFLAQSLSRLCKNPTFVVPAKAGTQ